MGFIKEHKCPFRLEQKCFYMVFIGHIAMKPIFQTFDTDTKRDLGSQTVNNDIAGYSRSTCFQSQDNGFYLQ